MKLMKRMFVLVLAIAMIMSFAACANTEETADAEDSAEVTNDTAEATNETMESTDEATQEAIEYLIGVTTFMDAEQASAEYKEGMETAAADLSIDGLTVTLTSFDPAGDASKQVTGLEDFISKGVDAMCFSAIDADAVVPIVDEARELGIKVVAFDQQINTETDGQVTIDNPSVGILCAETLAEMLNYEGKVFVIEAPPAVISCLERTNAAIEVFEGYGMEVVNMVSDAPDRDTHFTVTENVLQANPDIIGMIGLDTDTTLGQVLACESQGRDDIIVVGPDITPESREILAKDKNLKAMIDTIHFELGYQAIVTTVKILMGETVEPVVLEEFGVVTPAMAQEQLAE